MTDTNYKDSDRFCQQYFIQDTYFEDNACPSS